jgi:hypothetical protein
VRTSLGVGDGTPGQRIQVAPRLGLHYAGGSFLCSAPMASPLQRRLKGSEDGLGEIVTQLAKVKRRLNILAAQQLTFSTLGLLIGAGGILVIAAFILTATHFLVLGLLLAILLAVGLPLAITRALRRFAGLGRTAAIVDQRAEFNGRASTLLSLAEKDGDYPTLWPFLVEDTRGRLDDFQPNRIEKRRISRSIYGFTAACLIASLAGLMTYSARRHEEALRKILKNLTLQLDPSEIAPSDNPSGDMAQIEGDPETLRNLADRLEAANQDAGGGHQNALNRLANKAKDMASSLQDRLTGRQLQDTPEKVKIRLAQALGDNPPADENDSGDKNSNPADEKAGHPPGASSENPGMKSNPDAQQNPADNSADSTAPDQSPPPSSPSAKNFEAGGPEGPGAGDQPVAGQRQGSSPESSGETAGEGSDPDHLMGPPDAPSHKNENFEIMIDARLSDRSPIASAQPYVPPKVKTALNSRQHPDEPLDRGTVPPADRDTIRRVFER